MLTHNMDLIFFPYFFNCFSLKPAGISDFPARYVNIYYRQTNVLNCIDLTQVILVSHIKLNLFNYKEFVKICSVHHKHIFKPSNIMVINIDV